MNFWIWCFQYLALAWRRGSCFGYSRAFALACQGWKNAYCVDSVGILLSFSLLRTVAWLSGVTSPCSQWNLMAGALFSFHPDPCSSDGVHKRRKTRRTCHLNMFPPRCWDRGLASKWQTTGTSCCRPVPAPGSSPSTPPPSHLAAGHVSLGSRRLDSSHCRDAHMDTTGATGTSL